MDFNKNKISDKIIDGKKISDKIREEIKEEVRQLRLSKNIVPGLSVILIGDNPASKVYVKMKRKGCEYVGINSYEYNLPQDIDETSVIDLIEKLNNDDKSDGILLQLPIPKHLDEEKIISTISPEKDVDGFTPYNFGRLISGTQIFSPCTPLGIIELLKSENINLAGKDVVILGRSKIVGKPLALMLIAENCTVTVCHTKTVDMEEKCKKSDILICAMGNPKFIKSNHICKSAIVVDVGVNRLDDGKLSGDVDFDDCIDKVQKITPVPGGVGPMTVTMLLKNTLKAATKRRIN